MRKILIANKFYYNRGGDCVASIALEKLLKEKKNKIAFFSMKHPENFTSEWEKYFPSNVDFQNAGLINKIKAFNRIIYSKEVIKKFSELIEVFKPDIVHLNNIHSQLSPILGEIAHKKKIKVIWTLHDYKLICPVYSCLRSGNICENCITKSSLNVVTNKCMKDSYLASILAYLESTIWNKKRLIRNTDYFIAPSAFMKDMMIKGGFPKSKIKILPNFMNREFPTQIVQNKEKYYCYVGRLSREKGLNTLINAAINLPYKLIVVGNGPLREELEAKCSNSNIQFVGYQNWNNISSIVSKAKFTILPSEWYENNPLSIIESLCLGTPVLGANIGGIPELINNQNGMTFEPGNQKDLEEKTQQMFKKVFNYNDICNIARIQFSAENYYNQLIKIYD